MSIIVSRNPRNGSVLKEIQKTPLEEMPRIFERAAKAQLLWSKISVKQRARKMIHVREVICRRLDEIARTINLENGKPEIEAITSELIPSIELLAYYAKLAPKKLKDHEIRFRNPFMSYRRSLIAHQPIGTVAVISPWNFPFWLSFGDIACALLTGNAVVYKPSEHASLIGQTIQEIFDEAGLPSDLLQTVYGEGELGSAIIDQKPAKIAFTGSVRTGKAIMKQASQYLIPVSLELGGKDAMIVLPDADLDYASSAALWGGFTNSGQACASTERLIVHESISAEFISKLKDKIALLSSDTDLGVCTMEKQKQTYEEHLQDARERNLEFYAGGIMSSDRTRMLPTLVGGKEIEKSRIYIEETFGPVIAITTFRTVKEAIEKANRSAYGLLASVITKNMSLGEEIARELQVGSVLINEVIYTAGMAETPWGGVKDSGFGRKYSEDGLYEFTHRKHINRPRFAFLTFKSWWWFPYTEYQFQFFKAWAGMYKGGAFEKMFNFPHFLWALLKFLRNEPRL